MSHFTGAPACGSTPAGPICQYWSRNSRVVSACQSFSGVVRM